MLKKITKFITIAIIMTAILISTMFAFTNILLPSKAMAEVNQNALINQISTVETSEVILGGIEMTQTVSTTITNDKVITNYQFSTRANTHARIEVGLKGKNSAVTATTLMASTSGFPTCEIYVILYASQLLRDLAIEREACESYAYKADLNIYKSLSASKSTNGEVKYWANHTYMKVNSGDWNIYPSSRFLYGFAGNFIQDMGM